MIGHLHTKARQAIRAGAITILIVTAVGCGTQGSATVTREVFNESVVGKTPNEVLQTIGKPDRTDGDGTNPGDDWFYEQRTADAITGKTDSSAMVVFQHGRVDHVVY